MASNPSRIDIESPISNLVLSTMSSRKAYINVDLGEGYGNYSCGPDEHLIPMIDHANVACGFQ